MCSPVAEPQPAVFALGMTVAVERPAIVAPRIAAAVALAESLIVATPEVETVAPLVVAAPPTLPLGAVQASRPGDLTAALIEPVAGDAPLLDLIDRLPPPQQSTHDKSRYEALTVNLKTCTMDELWLGDFQLEDPRGASLVEQIASAAKDLFRSITLRLGFGRHSMIAYRGGRAPLPA
jgi:cell division protein FtsZ